MTDFSHSTQLQQWIYTPQLLQLSRKKANRLARQYLCSEPAPNQPVFDFARGFNKTDEGLENGPAENRTGDPFLTPEEEGRLVDFYAAKLPSLIGPLAQLPKLRREVKVSATAALLFRRFYLSNSVMLFDPKAIMVASAFLASKVEDAMSPVRALTGTLFTYDFIILAPMLVMFSMTIKHSNTLSCPDSLTITNRFNILKKGRNS